MAAAAKQPPRVDGTTTTSSSVARRGMAIALHQLKAHHTRWWYWTIITASNPLCAKIACGP
jgi:hypothetical protein